MVCTSNHTDLCPPFFFLFSFADKSFPRPAVSPEDVVVLRNEEARFHCQFIAVPEPKLEWYHENELLTNKSRFVEVLPITLLLCHRPFYSPTLEAPAAWLLF